MVMNKLFIGVLLCSSFLTHSKSWNEILTETEGVQFNPESPYFESPLLINSKLIFKGFSNEQVGLWSYNVQSNQLINLIPSDENHYLNDMIQFGDSVYFLLRRPDEESFYKLWQTDGSLSGTTLVSDTKFIPGSLVSSAFFIHENTLFAEGGNGMILEFNGEEIISHDNQIYEPILKNMCVFGEQDFIIYDFYGNRSVVRVTENTATDLSDSFPAGFVVQSMVDINNECYIHFTEGFSSTAPLDILKISPSGETKLFSESESLNNIYQLFEHNNQKFAFRNNQDEANSSSLVQLTVDDVVLNFEFTLPGGAFIEFISTQSNLWINFAESQTGIYNHYSMDDELTAQFIRSGDYLDLPSHHTSLDSEVLVYEPEDDSGKIDLAVLKNHGEQVNYQSQGFDYIDTISSGLSNDIYFILRERDTGLQSIFALKDRPKIGKSLNGIWADPELENQGLFIKHGVRANGSNYIFATMYTYRNSNPLWLAGVEDFMPNQDAIAINLTEFRGTGFLQLVEEPIQTTFGSLEIKPTGCDELQATVLHNNETTELKATDTTIE